MLLQSKEDLEKGDAKSVPSGGARSIRSSSDAKPAVGPPQDSPESAAEVVLRLHPTRELYRVTVGKGEEGRTNGNCDVLAFCCNGFDRFSIIVRSAGSNEQCLMLVRVEVTIIRDDA